MGSINFSGEFLGKKRVKILLYSMAVVVIAAFVVWWVYYRSYIYTNDARIMSDVIQIAPQGVGGSVIKLYADEGGDVIAGQTLAELDHRILLAQYEKAKARFDLALSDLERAKDLIKQKFISTQDMDNKQTNYDLAKAELDIAKVNLDNTYLKSPVDGIVIKRSAQEGDIIEPGQSVMIVSDVGSAWVSANIEETSVGRIKIGQKAQISLDEGGSLTGKVSEINSATLAQFSLMPAENASGNFTKVTQRIPIKITLDPHPNKKVLKTGESVTVKIRTF